MSNVTIGRIVWYRTDGRNGISYDLPAVVNCTRDTHPGDYPDGRNNPLPVPADDHVHLTVFTPGGFGTRVVTGSDGDAITPTSDETFVGSLGLVPGSGTYVELNVPYDPDASPRSWRWPERNDA